MFEGFPYTNFHELNLDWIIKIAKDFLDQYTNIQQTITQGLEDLDTKAEQLQALLDAWYEEHSQDIANQLAEALQDLNTWYNTHTGYLNDELAANIAAFNLRAEQKATETIATIPDDYTALSNKVLNLYDARNLLFAAEYHANYYYNAGYTGASYDYSYFVIPVESGHTYLFSPAIRIISKQSTLIDQHIYTDYSYTADYTGDLYVTFFNNRNGWKCTEVDNIGDVEPFKSGIYLNQYVNAQTDGRNILFSAGYYPDKYYNGSEHAAVDQYDYFRFPVYSGVTYYIYPGARFFVKSDGTELHTPNDHNPFEYTADYTGLAFLSLWKNDIYPQIVTTYSTRPDAVMPFNQADLSYYTYRFKSSVNFYGKKILNIGDSIAENRPQYDALSYAVQFAKASGAQLTTDYALSGSTLSYDEEEQGTRGCIYQQAERAIRDHADAGYNIIMIDGGANDFSLQRPLGAIVGTPGQYQASDYTATFQKSTILGALEYIFQILRNQYVSAIIVFVIPHKHTRTGEFWNNILNGIREVCRKWSILVIDIDKDGELNTMLPDMRIYTDAGGTHPNTDGIAKFYLPYLMEQLFKFFRT